MLDPVLLLNAAVMALAIGSHLFAGRGDRIQWGPCNPSVTNDTSSSLACGFFHVPLDYHDASAGTARRRVWPGNGGGPCREQPWWAKARERVGRDACARARLPKFDHELRVFCQVELASGRKGAPGREMAEEDSSARPCTASPSPAAM